MYFFSEGGAQNLRSLTVCETEAAKTLSCTVVCNPALVDTLQTVTVLRPSDYEGYYFEGKVMKWFFRNSKALRNAELVLSSGRISSNDDNDNEDRYARYKASARTLGCILSTLDLTFPFPLLPC